MKYLYTLGSFFGALLLLGLAPAVMAQQARETTAQLQEVNRPVFTIEFDYPPDIVEGALMEKLEKDQVKVRDKKHLITGQHVTYGALSASPLDLYFRTSGKEKKGKGTATLELFLSKGQDNFIGNAFDPELSQKATAYLDGLRPIVDEYALRQTIEEKEQALEDLRDDYENLLKDKGKGYDKLDDAKEDLSRASEDKALKKARKRIRKSDKKIGKMEDELRRLETEMEQRKSALRVLRQRLTEMQREIRS